MQIHYLNCDNKYKLFSFHRHDYKTKEINGITYMIDGGLNDYIRASTYGEIEYAEVKDVIKDIREQLSWGKNYDANKKLLPKTEYVLLKDIEDKHLEALIDYTNGRNDKHGLIINDIFKQEKEYRKLLNK